MLYFIYQLLSILFIVEIILFVLYLLSQIVLHLLSRKKLLRGKRYIPFCFVFIVIITLIFWSFAFISLYEHIDHLNNTAHRMNLGGKTKEELIAIIGQNPTNVSNLTSPNNDSVKENIVLTYKYQFPPFDVCFEFEFINNELTCISEEY